MCDCLFELTTTCAYCLRKAGKEIDAVYPVYDWKTNKLLGYYCKEHFLKVKIRNLIEETVEKQANPVEA
ncbi:hypothetical protein QQ991_00120 [Weizmannia coagulans]|jgi:predicted phosphoadenosine phosphosulfate sulfurtransferase|uniref:Uncharacterized protein n=3 Tax=Heyndrickxia TaxID=2837504 RepID=A0A0C5C3B6_HEYCO|nr:MULTISPECIES: hypothetical protein [Heyndrickxia]NWN93662.1 hypothetical protein [Bacillus sp. (in: firmicutes)]AEH54697.1 hypothetical protein BCO26_2639 [Heyndrickxia coagulans 2-6]AEP00830.1 hypothetical protein Bcoa_1633 [Heyndrickxia coagulans 36D1]AJO21231.1 hypothetical protein SB48_HM08orf00675 [Heyndrickxia coagulans]AKN53133.1 hypothetical protein AB434_0728 [Heyndrickxia coagulans]